MKRLIVSLLLVLILSGSAEGYSLKTMVIVTNKSDAPARNVTVSIPLLENDSPYSIATVKSGSQMTYIDEIPPRASHTVIIEYDVELIRPMVKDRRSDDYILAYWYFDKHKGSGNCRDLTRAYIADLHKAGFEAREVVGWARPKRGDMTAGDLRGSRHSWAEVKIKGRWLPVDLTFGYFGEFPHTSHIVDGYEDRGVSIKHTGGRLTASWFNGVTE